VDDPGRPDRSLPFGIALFEQDTPPNVESALDDCNAALAARGLTELAGLIVTADRDELPTGVTGKVLKRTLREQRRTVLSEPPGAHTALAPGAALAGGGGGRA
jgi:hypothetical protein